MSGRISLGTAWEQTRSFMRREGSLILPVAFATFGIALVLLSFAMPDPTAAGEIETGPWALAIIPLTFLGILGQLAISYLVLRPGSSVRDALATGVKRLPQALGVIVVMVLALLVSTFVLGLVLGLIVTASGASAGALTAIVAFLLFGALLWIGARLLMIWPMLADRRDGPVATLKSSYAISRGLVLRFITLMLMFLLIYMLVTAAVQLGLGSVLILVGRMIGSEAAATFLVAIVVALLGAVIQAFWAVLLANIYRQLTAPVGQTVP